MEKVYKEIGKFSTRLGFREWRMWDKGVEILTDLQVLQKYSFKW